MKIYKKKEILAQIDKVRREGADTPIFQQGANDLALRILDIELVLAKMQSIQSTHFPGADQD